jgi:hypothetical protein
LAISGRIAAESITMLAGLLISALWFALPLLRRNAERQRSPEAAPRRDDATRATMSSERLTSTRTGRL